MSVSASAYAQQPDQPQQPPVNEDKVKEPKAAVDKAPPPPPVPSTQIGARPAGDSLAAAARKARDAKKDQSQAGTAQSLYTATVSGIGFGLAALMAGALYGRVGGAAHDIAVGRVFQMFRIQATVLAYSDVFLLCAIVAFIVVPLSLLLSPRKSGGRPGGAH